MSIQCLDWAEFHKWFLSGTWPFLYKRIDDQRHDKCHRQIGNVAFVQTTCGMVKRLLITSTTHAMSQKLLKTLQSCITLIIVRDAISTDAIYPLLCIVNIQLNGCTKPMRLFVVFERNSRWWSLSHLLDFAITFPLWCSGQWFTMYLLKSPWRLIMLDYQ